MHNRCCIDRPHSWPGSPLPCSVLAATSYRVVESCSTELCSTAQISISGNRVNAAVLLQRYERNIKKGMLTDETIMLWNERWELES